MNPDRQAIIERSVVEWPERPELDPVQVVNAALDLADLPRLRAEERAVITRECLADAPR